MESPVLELVGKTAAPTDAVEADGPTPPSYAELGVIDQISELLPTPAPRTTVLLSRVSEQQLRVLKLLDRFGLMTSAQLRRAAWPPGVSDRGVQKALARLESAGLLQRTPTRLRAQSRRASPPLWSLTARGFRLGQEPHDGLPPVIAARRRYRASEARDGARVRHDLHVVNWMQALHSTIPAWCTDNWRTSRYHTARFTPPRIGDGRGRRALRPSDIPLGPGHGFSNVPQRLEEIVADLAVELYVVSDPSPRPGRRYEQRFDLLLELDLTERRAYNLEKFARYDAFLTGWCLAHPRYRRLGTRPIVVFASPSPRATLALMHEADEVMTGSVGPLGRPEHDWYFAGRAHTFFVTEGDIHHGSLRALQLPPVPRRLREQLGDSSFSVTAVNLLPERVAAAGQR